jgi:hypothetical protein
VGTQRVEPERLAAELQKLAGVAGDHTAFEVEDVGVLARQPVDSHFVSVRP